ncbi:MAG: Fic family protein [Actinobacteria bacterium]|nr:Fic family protein [Actinomycetota bacterium]
MFSGPPGATPLTEEEKEGLIPRAITVKSELDGAELENILKANIWLDRSQMSVEQLLTARFHHRLVQIHLFVNGNGRHARLITDKLLRILGEKEFTWGSSNIDEDGPARHEYIQALKDADSHDLSALMRFVRS